MTSTGIHHNVPAALFAILCLASAVIRTIRTNLKETQP